MAKAERVDGRLMKAGKSARGALYGAISLGVFAGMLIIVQAWLLARIVNAVAFHGQSLATQWGLLAVLLGLFVLRAGLSWASEIVAFRASASIKTDLRRELLQHLFARGPVPLAGERSGDLATTLIDGVEALEPYFSRYLPQMALVSLIPLAILVVVFPVDWISGLILLICGPLIPFFMVLVGYAAEAINQRQWRQLLLMSSHFLDVLQGLTTLKIFGRAKDEIAIVAHLSDEYRKTTMAGLRVAFLTSAVLEFFASLGIALVAVSLGVRLLQVHAAIDFYAAFFVLLLAPEYFSPLRGLATHYHARMSAIAAAKRIFEILDAPLPPVPQAPLEVLPAVREGVSLRLEDLHYRYDPEGPEALAGFSAAFPAGSYTALVGSSGAGKSTVANAILGFVQPEKGKIWVDGVDLHGIDPRSWYEQIAWIPQNPRLFAGSIADNLRLARPQASPEELREAAQAANALSFIEALPHAWDTQLGDLGSGISGGQVQRLALARAFLRDPRLLILDEATANLDMESEALFLDSLERLRQGRTVIVIAHRLATANRAEQVIVVDAGRVIEQGMPAQLLSQGGAYARLVHTYRGQYHA